MEIESKLRLCLGERLEELRRFKAKGGKIIGYVPNGYMPVELVYASGAIPVGLIRGGDPDAVTASLAYLPRFLDTFCRAQIGYKMMGTEPLYQMIDSLVAPVTDNNIRAIADSFNFYTDVKIFRFGIPHAEGDDAVRYYLEGIHLLKEYLEKFTGNKITDERLTEAIESCNKMRALLRKLSLSRQDNPAAICSSDFVRLNHASYYLDPVNLIHILQSVNEQPGKEVTISSGKPRIMLCGSTLAWGDDKVLSLVEAAGGDIVVEDFSEGVRNYWAEVRVDGDPLEALADRYFRRRTHLAFFRATRAPIDHVLKLAKDFDVDGVLYYHLMYRDSYCAQAFYLEHFLKKELDLPMLEIESDYDAGERGPMSTRIETFVETLRGLS